jgi:hypothetical protein
MRSLASAFQPPRVNIFLCDAMHVCLSPRVWLGLNHKTATELTAVLHRRSRPARHARAANWIAEISFALGRHAGVATKFDWISRAAAIFHRASETGWQ